VGGRLVVQCARRIYYVAESEAGEGGIEIKEKQRKESKHGCLCSGIALDFAMLSEA